MRIIVMFMYIGGIVALKRNLPMGIQVMTANPRDYRRLAEFHPFKWQVVDV
jgi:hypothetical protein